MDSYRLSERQIVVIGASGFLGLNLIGALQAANLAPTCLYRGRVPRLTLRRTGVSTVPGDLDERETLVEALRGADVVFHFAGHYPDLSVDYEATMAVGERQTQNVLDACGEAGVERLVFLSSVGSVAPSAEGPSTEEDVFDEPPGHGVYHDVKWRMEKLVSDESRFETITLCPGACLGPWDMRIGTSIMLVALARGESVQHPDGWINICDSRDVGEIAVGIAGLASPPERLLLSGGNYRLHDFLVRLAQRYGVAPPPPALDDDEAVRLANEEEHRAAEAGERAEVSRELVDLTIHGVPVDASLATRLIDHEYRSLTDTLDAYDRWARERRILPPQTETRSTP